MSVTIVSVDLAKNIFHINAVDRHDSVVFRASRRRQNWVEHVCERIGPIAMEACVSAHHWGRRQRTRRYLAAWARMVPAAAWAVVSCQGTADL